MFDNRIFIDILELSRYVSVNGKTLDFKIHNLAILRNDTICVSHINTSIDPQKQKKLRLNKSKFCYQKSKFKDGTLINICNKTMVIIE